MNHEVVILLAHERSGSNLLRQILKTGSSIHCEGEVCKIETDQERESPRNFFHHRAEMIKSDQKYAYPLMETQNAIIASYFDALSRLNLRASHTVIDVKYSHVHNFNSFWTSNTMAPQLFRYARERRVKLIHLYRRNTLLAALSNELAIERKVWNTSNRDQLEHKTITVNPQRVLRETRKLKEWQREMSTHCKGLEHIEINYEDLTEDGLFSKSLSEQISEFLGVAADWNMTPELVKVSPPPEDFVENLDDLGAHFAAKGAEHLWFLR